VPGYIAHPSHTSTEFSVLSALRGAGLPVGGGPLRRTAENPVVSPLLHRSSSLCRGSAGAPGLVGVALATSRSALNCGQVSASRRTGSSQTVAGCFQPNPKDSSLLANWLPF
jgi:hypothetical protein